MSSTVFQCIPKARPSLDSHIRFQATNARSQGPVVICLNPSWIPVSFCLSIQSMALFLSLLSFCGWSFFPFFILHKCIECFFGGRLPCLSFTASFPCCPKGLIFYLKLYR
ncbi:hypothetical protein RND81_03G083900 [Saponaria officinalis]|uniref:Uncharacterized protein n=1 Tax=Saponaria officinalis TaxID=3572 RepID=A0AAW1LYZ7_SAPOF